MVSMNSRSNSAKRSALLATEQVRHDREVPVTTGSLSCLLCMQSREHSCACCAHGRSTARAALPLVCSLKLMPRPVVRAPSTLSRSQACPMGRDKKTLCRNTTLGKPCRNIKSYVAKRMSHPWENFVVT